MINQLIENFTCFEWNWEIAILWHEASICFEMSLILVFQFNSNRETLTQYIDKSVMINQ